MNIKSEIANEQQGFKCLFLAGAR